MLIIPTERKAARKMSWLMAIYFLLSGGSLVLIMHFYVRPKDKPVPNGFQFLGFPRTKKS